MNPGVQALVEIADSNVVWDHGAVERCEVVTDFHRLQELWPEWQRLWESDCRAEIFQTPEWTEAWWLAFGGNYDLATVVVFVGERARGILPLVRRGRQLQFLGVPQADYADVICQESDSAEVLALALKTLMESVPGWDECSLQHLSRNSRFVRYYRRLPKEVRERLRCLPAQRQQTIILRTQRESVFQSLLGKHHTRRLQNKLRKAGQLRFRHLTGQEAEDSLPDFFRHHIRRHAALGRQSMCADPAFCKFIRTLVRELGRTDRVRFGVLELNGRPLAWDLGFQVNGKLLLYQHTFDLDAWHYTPGEVLLWNELRYASEHVSREFDFGSGDELYKDRFANYSRETFSLYLEHPSVKGKLRGWGRLAQACFLPVTSRAKELAKNHRVLMRAFRSVRMWTIGTLSCFRQARKNGATFACGIQIAQKLFRNSILSKQSTDVFVLETGIMQGATLSPEAGQGDLKVGVAPLGELVDLAWERPNILSLNDLPLFRKRLKNDDQVYIVREQSRVLIVCWVSSMAQASSGPGQHKGLTPSHSALVVDEFWSSRDCDLSQAYRLLLSRLTHEAAIRGAHLMVHCGSRQPSLRKELLRQGFRPKFQSIRYKFFSHFHRDSLSRYPENTLRPPQLV